MIKAAENKKVYIHVFIMFALGLIVSNLPPFGLITTAGMKVLGVFVVLIYGWIFVDIFWVSLIGFILLSFTGVLTLNEELASAFSDNTMLVLIFVTALAGGLDDLGFGDAIAKFMLSRKIIMGRPWILIIFLCLLGALMSLVNKNILGALLIWKLVDDICKICGYEKGDPVKSFINCMVAYSCFMPTFFAPYASSLPLYAGIYRRGVGDVELLFGQFFIWGLIAIVISMGLLFLIAKYIFHLDVSKFNMTEEIRETFISKKISKVTKVALVTLLVYIVILCSPAFLSKELPLVIFINKLGIVGWTIIYLAIFALWRDANGEPHLNLQRAFSKVQWPLIMLYGITIPMGNALGSSDAGVMVTMSGYIAPIISQFDVIGIYIFSFVFLALATQLFHNMIVAVLCIPLMAPIAIAAGCNPQVLFFIMFVALNTAFSTPAASMMSGLMFGSQSIDRKYAYIWGVLQLLAVAIAMLIVAPLLNLTT